MEGVNFIHIPYWRNLITGTIYRLWWTGFIISITAWWVVFQIWLICGIKNWFGRISIQIDLYHSSNLPLKQRFLSVKEIFSCFMLDPVTSEDS